LHTAPRAQFVVEKPDFGDISPPLSKSRRNFLLVRQELVLEEDRVLICAGAFGKTGTGGVGEDPQNVADRKAADAAAGFGVVEFAGAGF
jgi:hypothetical protein